MADASRPPSPHDWRDVFAAMPLESPPESRWSRIEATLRAQSGPRAHPARGARRRPWLRVAAAAAALALLPLIWIAADRDSADVAVAPGDRPPTTTPVAPRHVTAPAPVPPPAPVARIADRPSALHATPTPAVMPQPHARDRLPTPASTHDTRATRALADVTRGAWPNPRVAAAHDDETSTHMQASFEILYADGARLEAFLSEARDPRVASGPAAALTAALDNELAAVDTVLAQPDLGTEQQLALWRKRVELLRESAELESQLRLLAAEGRRLDGASAELH